MSNNINLTIPAHSKDEFLKLVSRASKNITGLQWTVGETRKQTFRHYFDGDIVKMTHSVIDVTISLPEVNDWVLVATVIEGAIFITDNKQQLVLKNGHGADYRLCDVCKHKQWKKSFIVRNSKTNEELQIGAECAKKFGIGMMNAIHNLTKELYANYSLYSCEYDGLEPIEWPAHISDPHAVKSVETSVMVQAAKHYYDENNGVWKKGYYVGRMYYPSESAAEIRASIDKFTADADNAYYKELAQWVSNVFEEDVCSEFDDKIKCVGTDFYMSAGDTAAAFFAIKKYESWKKEQAAKAAGLYIPKRGDYIHIVGKVINKETKSGYFGAYIEYEILNKLDGNTYKRSGAVKADGDNNVDCYAFIRDVFKGQNILDRTTLKAKKGVAIANVLQ